MKRKNPNTVLTLIVAPLLTFGLAAMGLVSPLRAEGPQTIGFQGFLTNIGGTPLNASPSIEFCLYTVVSGGSSVWCETQAVTVTDGIFSVRLGSVNPLTTVPFDEQYYLGMNVAGDGEMSPRQSLEAGPYALRSKAGDSTTTVSVNCGTGGSINDALEAGARIVNISGTCAESVVIENDDVQLIGISSATIAPTAPNKHGITVTSTAQDVVLKDLTVTGTNDGIRVTSGGTATIIGVTVEDSTNHGINVRWNSTVWLYVTASTVRNNGGDGIRVYYSSALYAEDVTVSGNGGDGIRVHYASALGADTVTVTGNTGAGIRADQASSGDINNSTVSTNQKSGFQIYGSSRFGLQNNTISGNTIAGLNIGSESTGWIKNNTITNNDGGGIVVNAGALNLAGGNTVSNNGAQGIYADHASIKQSLPISAADAFTGHTWAGINLLNGSNAGFRNLTLSGNIGDAQLRIDRGSTAEIGPPSGGPAVTITENDADLANSPHAVYVGVLSYLHIRPASADIVLPTITGGVTCNQHAVVNSTNTAATGVDQFNTCDSE